MTLLCAPAEADLYEINHGTHKTLHDPSGTIRFVDVDWKSSYKNAAAPLIVSYHNFEETPQDLDTLLKQLKQTPARFYKIATMARSCLDSMRMLEFVKQHDDVIGLCMGELGQITRILAPVVGTPIMYSYVTEPMAPGQVSLKELVHLYRFRSLNRNTVIYGVMGDPVSQSIGHLFHNHNMPNGVYVKIHVKPHELGPFLSYAKKLGFRGLSVTIPHKEAVLPFIDRIDPEAREIGAVNTLLFEKDKIFGFNTDAKGAHDALEQNVHGKKVVVLGAGGASKAVVYALKKAGAKVSVLNRTSEKGDGPLEQLSKERYDILINTTPHPCPIHPEWIAPGSTVMDISLKESELLRQAALKQCRTIPGLEMYYRQALAQRTIWQLPPREWADLPL